MGWGSYILKSDTHQRTYIRGHMNRVKQAVCRGYQARIDNKPITENPYLTLGNRYMHLSGQFEKGWYKADQKVGRNLSAQLAQDD